MAVQEGNESWFSIVTLKKKGINYGNWSEQTVNFSFTVIFYFTAFNFICVQLYSMQEN